MRTPINHNPNRSGTDPSLTLAPGDALYVAWTEYDGAHWQLRVSTLDDATGTWTANEAGAPPLNPTHADRGCARPEHRRRRRRPVRRLVGVGRRALAGAGLLVYGLRAGRR